MSGMLLYQASFAFYLAAAAAYLAYAAVPRRGLASLALLLFTAGAALLLFFGIGLWARTGRLPLLTAFEALGLWTLTVSAVFLAFEWRWRLDLLGAFIAPLAMLTHLMGFRFVKLVQAAAPPAGLDQPWLFVHVALSMAGYAAFTVSFAVAVAFLLQARQLKSHKLGELFYELPPLVELERLVFVSLRAGVFALALGLAAGAAWQARERALSLGDDPKVLLSLCALAWFGGAWLLRARGILAGHKAALAVILGFVALFFGFYLANTVGGGHAF